MKNQNAETARLQELLARFAPVDMEADITGLPRCERQALAKLVQAADILDALFLRQCWAGNETMLLRLLKDASPLGAARLKFFLNQKGPWDRQDGNKPFIPGAPKKPAGANYYPDDATKAEVAEWIAGLPEPEQSAAKGFFTVVRRDEKGGLKLVPYCTEYGNELVRAAGLLKEAAGLTRQRTLKTYLEKRAAAFLSNDYYDSDVAWLELDASIEPTIGPYENYEDEWFNYKAAFEAVIGVRDDRETVKLAKFGEHLQWLEDRLPIAPALRNPKLGALAPIRVINQVYASGDAARGVAAAAFNLPNDERVIREKGAKRVMMKNVQEAKFRMVLVPLARLALSPKDRKGVSFEAFFTHILMHELMHGLGPHDIPGPDGKPTTVRQALKECYSAFEEAKADISGLWALQQLVDKGELPAALGRTMYVTFLASSFRTLRFGVTESHGKGMCLQMNFLLERGGIRAAKNGTFSVVTEKFRAAVTELTGTIMEIQARGDRGAARAMLEKYGRLPPAAKRVLERARRLPVDIAPRHRTVELLTSMR